MSDNHTGENLADAIQLMLLEYDREINVGIGAITTDNGANVLKAINNVSISHVSCFGHSYNIAIKRVFKLDEVKSAMNKVKAIQNIFGYSWTAIREMSIEQRRYGLPTVKFPTYSKTRWWSLLDLMEVVVTQELALASFLRSYNNGIHKGKKYNEEEMIILKTLLHVLQPIRQISDNLAGETFVTASAIIPVIKILENKLTEIGNNENEININQTLKKTVLQTIVDLLQSRYNNNNILKICTALDPRFKFEIYNAENSIIKMLIKDECIKVWEYWIKSLNNTSISDPEPQKKKKKCWFDCNI